MIKPAPSGPRPVLLFDGECGLCIRVVRLLLHLDRRGRLRFAPLQGAAGQAYLRAHGLPTEDFSTLVFVADWDAAPMAAGPGSSHRLKTAGAVAALRACGGVGRLLGSLLRLAPAFWRDAAYRAIARRRRWFGRPPDRNWVRPEWTTRLLG